MNSDNQSPERLFEAALHLTSPAQRTSFLNGACGGDVQLRQRVEALLKNYEQAGQFLEQPPAAFSPNSLAVTTGMVPVTEKPGDKIGRYKLREQIGVGGCGVVYVAEQEDPVRRRVALKVIKLGMDTKQVVARFEAERQALALMDHPNIAKVFDAGATETGRPYFVMELVRGIKITDYCDQNNLSTEERLKLFIQVCHAIQHAHQKGVIHRDIKPSNILVTLHDGVPVPKVIDFGIAKATGDQRLTDKTIYTAFEQFIGTPAYMSPEQAEMSGLDVDTRSDIYALGVLLYELLTGKTPLDAQRLVAAGLDEIRRIIREEDPPRPSTRISTLDAAEQTAIAKRRHAEPPKLLGLIRGDLDWIVMKTLEKDRTRRYETANGLATDVQRHLNNEPVVARPQSNFYRFRKMVRRNRLAAGSVTAVGLALMLGIAGFAWQALRATRAEREQRMLRLNALANAARAKNEAARAEAAAAEAKMALSTSDFLQACRFIVEDKDHDAVAYLVASLRVNPANDAAVTRLATLLTYRAWLRPIICIQHAAPVTSTQFSPDGKRLVSASMDSTARVWDAQTGLPLTDPIKHAFWVSSAQFSPDGKQLVTVSTNVAQVWNAQTGQPVTGPLKHAGQVTSVQFSPDGKRLVTASEDNTARVWDVQTGQPVTDPLKHPGPVHSAQFSPDGKWVVTASGDGTARVWNAQSGQPLTEPLKHARTVRSAQFSPDGKRVVTAAEDNTARVWDAQTGQPLTDPFKHAGTVTSAHFSPDGKRVVTASEDNTARVWDAQTGRPLTDPLKHAETVTSAHFSPEGKRVVTVSEDNAVRVWDAQTGQPLTEPVKHAESVTAVQFSPDGKRLVTASVDGTARLWDAQASQPLAESLNHAGTVTSAQFSPEGKRVVTASEDNTARVWDAQTGQPLTESLNHAGTVTSARFSPEGKRVVTASEDNTARVWDAQRGQPLTEPLKHAGQVTTAQFSPDGKWVVTASEDGTARVWDAQTGQPLTDPFKHAGTVYSAQFSPDGRRVVTASADGTAQVWDVQAGQALTAPLKHAGTVYSAQFSPDGRRVVTASADGTAQVWDAQAGQPLTAPLKHVGTVHSAQFSLDGKRVVTAAEDNTARVWDAQTGQPLTDPFKHAGTVYSAQFSPDGRRVVTASEDNIARVWDVQTGQPLTDPFKHAGTVYSAQFSPDGKRVVTASEDNTAQVWDVAPSSAGYPGWLLQLATAACNEVLNAQGVLEYTNQFEAIDQLRQTLSQQTGGDDWLVLGRWLLAGASARTISPFSKITLAEWIERRLKEATMETMAALEQLAILTGDAELLERVSQARPAVERAEAALASAQGTARLPITLNEQCYGASRGEAKSLNALARLFAASSREELRGGHIALILAERAAIATHRKDPVVLDTLAASLAEAVRFPEAVLVQREALGLLRDDKNKEEYVSRLKLYESNAPYREAASNDLTPAPDDRLAMAALLRARGVLCAQFAQWTSAARDLTKAIELNPTNHLNWYQLAPLLAQKGDTFAYRQHCQAMLARFGTTTDASIAETTAKVCLMLSVHGPDQAAADKLAETAVSIGATEELVAYYQFAKGLADYRQDRFDSAADWERKVLSKEGIDHQRDVQAYMVLAMASHQLNQRDQARAALEKGGKIAETKLPKLESADLGSEWHDWIIAHALMREAKALIEGGSKAGDQPK
jgi:eukaryotic-like serine/threonine-protein kinase